MSDALPLSWVPKRHEKQGSSLDITKVLLFALTASRTASKRTGHPPLAPLTLPLAKACVATSPVLQLTISVQPLKINLQYNHNEYNNPLYNNV